MPPADLRRRDRESLKEEDRESAKGRKRESATSSLISKKPLPQNFAISLFRLFALKISFDARNVLTANRAKDANNAKDANRVFSALFVFFEAN
jgi:hypothetical protein